MDSERRPAVGFDFGTSTTLVARPDGVAPIGTESSWMPSVVGYGDDNTVAVVGEEAVYLPPDQVVRSIKRTITENRQFVRVDMPTGIKDVRADDLIVAVLREAVRRASTHDDLALTDDRALRLGCPAMWDGQQRRRLLKLAQAAGLPATLESFVDEPVAAGIAWLASGRVKTAEPMRVVVFDMGGGTLDIAVLDVRGLRHQDVSVLAAIGVAEAGDSLDQAIAEDLEYVLAAAGIDVDSLSDPDRARGRLRDAAREAKIALSTSEEQSLGLPRRTFGSADVWYTRQQLEDVFAPQMDRAELCVSAALRAARLTGLAASTAHEIMRTPLDALTAEIDVVVLSGGMSQIPYVSERLREMFPRSTTVELASRPPENAVSLGLALSGRYGRINMYRPAFDILLEWDRGGEFRVVYDAFTPLVESWQIAQGGSELCYLRTGLDLSLPRDGHGRLRVVSHTGQRVRASLGGKNLDGFPVAMSEQKFEFAIYPNGRIRMTDAGGTHDGQIDNWHTVQA